MPSRPMSELLQEWRSAERRWERPGTADEVRAAALEVVAAWAEYQDAALPAETDEFMLVADDDGRYVAATAGVRRVLGFEAAALVGRSIADLAAPARVEQTPEQWSRFLAEGRQGGTFELRSRDGETVSLRYQARAHHPIPGFHVSRLWPEESATDPISGAR